MMECDLSLHVELEAPVGVQVCADQALDSLD